MSSLETPWKIEEKIFGWMIIVFAFPLILTRTLVMGSQCVNKQSYDFSSE